MVQAVLDALSAPQGSGDLRTRPQRYHDALAEAMRRLLASDLLPQRAGHPVKALVPHQLRRPVEMDADSALQEQWIAGYRPGGLPTAPPRRSAPGTAGPGWTGTGPQDRL